MKIQTNKTELTPTDIAEIINAHEQDAANKRRLKRYFLGKHDEILRKAERADGAPNNRLISNYPAYISNMRRCFHKRLSKV